ncbi:MAG: hypothetical protein R2701_06110 [Acidimicrobiales bacterium]
MPVLGLAPRRSPIDAAPAPEPPAWALEPPTDVDGDGSPELPPAP